MLIVNNFFFFHSWSVISVSDNCNQYFFFWAGWCPSPYWETVLPWCIRLATTTTNSAQLWR